MAIATLVATLCYVAAAALLFVRLRKHPALPAHFKGLALGLATLAVLLHLWALLHELIVPHGLNLSLVNAASLSAVLINTLILVSAIGRPVENLGIATFTITAALLLATPFIPHGTILLGDTAPRGLQLHILLSLFSYSILTIATLQALLLALQNHQLKHRQPMGLIRGLPPLETMEEMLFRMIGLGYLLLSLSLVMGVPYVEDIFRQHLVHKTALSATAWVVFALLLWGRWRFGWRGRMAVRWTLGGFALLMLSYFGSKVVLEWVLQR